MDDVRFALRQLRKSVGFTVTATATLALGACAALAIFAFVEAALLRPLPFREPARLVGVYETAPLFPRSNLSYQDYLDWKRLNTVFSSLAVYNRTGGVLTTAAGVERVPATRVTDDFFRTLGVAPILGRDFRPGEDAASAARTALVSYGAWQSRFGGARDVLGRTIVLNGEPHTIVGVLPAGFHFAPAEPVDFWTTLHPAATGCDARRSCHNLYGVARLRPGVSVEAALANATSIAAALEEKYPDSNRDQGAAVVALEDVIVGPIRPILSALLGGALLLLLIAAVNVAGLLLVRAEGRRREIGVRGALGASRWRIVRQFAIEASVLTTAAVAAAVAGAAAAIRALTALVPQSAAAQLPFLHDASMTPTVGLAAVAIGAFAIALFTAAPLAQLSWARHASALAEGGRGSAGRAWRRAGSRLVIVEMALAMVLLAGGALLARSLYALLHVDLGLQPAHVAVVGVGLPRRVQDADAIAALTQQLVARVAALPGVESTGVASQPPLQGGNTVWIRVEGRPYHGEHNEVNYRSIDPGYFPTIRAQLLRGRGIARTDTASSPPVVVVNQALARKYFPAGDPIGARLLYASYPNVQPMEIVGVVDDIKESPLDADTPPTLYTALAQDADGGFFVFARTAQDEEAMLGPVGAAIRAADAGIVTFGASTLERLVGGSQPASIRRSGAWLVGAFAALSWVLGVIGLYGVVAYSVRQRTREIGVRMALGARPGAVAGLVLGEAGRLVAIGIVCGAGGSVVAATLLRGLLFGVSAWDASTVGGVAAVLACSALAASYLPARRAAAVSPVEALRAE